MNREPGDLSVIHHPLHFSLSLSVSVVMDHNIMIAVVGCACAINDVASRVRTTVSASTGPSGSNQKERAMISNLLISI